MPVCVSGSVWWNPHCMFLQQALATTIGYSARLPRIHKVGVEREGKSSLQLFMTWCSMFALGGDPGGVCVCVSLVQYACVPHPPWSATPLAGSAAGQAAPQASRQPAEHGAWHIHAATHAHRARGRTVVLHELELRTYGRGPKLGRHGTCRHRHVQIHSRTLARDVRTHTRT